MTSETVIYEATIYFSYNQFHVFDTSVKLPALRVDGTSLQAGLRRA